MNIKCHLCALRNAVELSLIASLISLCSDLYWLVHDISANGMSQAYCSIFIGLLLGNLLTLKALYSHHCDCVKEKDK